MNILVVGAGAVGQVYALHLARAGHRISFFVKEKYAAEIAGGLTLHRLSHFGDRQEELRGFDIVTDASAVAAAHWDQVWLTMSSDALRSELSMDVLKSVGAATVVCLQPDIGDGLLVRSVVPAQQVVQGMIAFISFQSPLPGRSGPDGIAFYLPPFVPTIIAGEKTRAGAVINALRHGGLHAKPVADFDRATAASTAMFQSLIATLESNQWNLRSLGASATLAPGLAAAREAVSITAKETGAATAQLQPLLLPLTWRLLLPLVLRLFPFDIEVYLRYHFTKVGVQTRLMLDSYIALGKALHMPTPALSALRHSLADTVSSAGDTPAITPRAPEANGLVSATECDPNAT